MDFDLDDPLSDDSFFDEPKALSKKSSTTTTKTSEKKSFENLFGLSDKNITESTTKTEPEISKPKHTVTFEDPVTKTDASASQKSKDFLDFGEPDRSASKKTNFLDDLLSVRPKSKLEKQVSSLDDILKDSKVSTSKPPTPVKEVGKPIDITSDFGMLSTTSRRRPRRGSSTALEDNLGLFGDEYQSGDYFTKDKKETVSKSAEDFLSKNKTETGMPDWLGGSLPSLNKTAIPILAETSTKIREPETIQSSGKAESVVNNPASNLPATASSAIERDISEHLKPQNINMEIQNTYSSLHQQESFLLLTLQMKKYEDTLNEIRNQQKDILGKQERQFNTLLDEYILKQQMTENNIRLQQERINNQIQMLISKSAIPKTDLHLENETEKHDHYAEETDKFINSLKQRHEEELFLIEESYKKQINMLEKSNEVLEEKLKIEMTNITHILEEKVNTVKDKYDNEIVYYREKLKDMEMQHHDETKLLKDNYSRVIDDMKTDHTSQLEYIKQMKQHENNLLGKSETYAQKIDSSIELLNSNTKVLQGIEEKVIENYDVLAIARENSLQAKEKEVILMRNTLEKCRAAAENERSQMLALIRNLEVKLAEQNHNAQEDRWTLQQASATLTARATALDREAEFNRKAIEREREQLKTLKESLLAEQEKMIMQITEEKLSLSSEKARLEVTSKLTNTYDVEKMRAEAEAAIQVAKELTEKVSHERNYLYRQKMELENLKRNLNEREKELDDKEVELEFLVQDTQQKLKDDKRVLAEAKMMENMYKERLQELQHQWASIGTREKKLAEEKVLLSKERLGLYTQLKTNKNCVLCKADGQMTHDSILPFSMHDLNLSSKVLDADTIRFKLDVEEENENEVSKEENISIRIKEK